ncbi:MAG: phage tail tape measure protein [Clostridiales bacterium]|nr:phage tail tape measure protein [Clostridiales bacterium]
MAKIILNVDLDSSPAQKELKVLESAIKGIASTLSNVKADKNLTTQINALTENYKALANVAQKVTKVNNQNAISEERLAQSKQKTRKETAKANTAESKETQERVKATQATEKLSNATEKNTKSTIQSTSAFLKGQIRTEAYNAAVNLLKSAFTSLNQTLVQTEDAVIALQRVLPEGSATDSQIVDDLYDMSQQYGQAFDGVQQAAQNFAKAGLDYEDSLKATKAALVAVNVAELDVTQATEGMIAIMTQFGYRAEDLMDIVDMLNKVGDQYAVSSDKLLTALQRTGSTAANANLSLEETIGLITAISEATGRSGENIGTAVNSLIQYTRKASSLEVFEQLSDGAAQAVEDFRLGGADILDVWREVSVAIGDMSAEQENLLNEWLATDEMQNLTQELHDELGDIFETEEQAYGTVNTYRQNYFIALLKNMDTVQEATETALNSQGYSIQENEKYMQTYTAQVTALTAQWQHLVSEEQGFLDFKKDLVAFASSLLQVIENTGGLSQLLKEIATFTAIAFAPKIISNVNKYASKLKNSISAIKTYINIEKSAKVQTTAIVTAEDAKTAAMARSAAATQAASAAMNFYSLAIGAVIAAYTIYKTVQSNKKQALIDAAEASEEAAEQTRQEGEELLELKKELEETGEATEELTNKFKEHVKNLDDFSTDVQNLTGDYKELSKSIREAMALQAQEQAESDSQALLDAQLLVEGNTEYSGDIAGSWDDYFRSYKEGYGENPVTYYLDKFTEGAYKTKLEELLEDTDLYGQAISLESLARNAKESGEIENIIKFYNELQTTKDELWKAIENGDYDDEQQKNKITEAYQIVNSQIHGMEYVAEYLEKLENSKYSNWFAKVTGYINTNPEILDTQEATENYVNNVLKEIDSDNVYSEEKYGDTEQQKENFLEIIELLTGYRIELDETGNAQVEVSNTTDETTEALEKQSEALDTISKSFSTAKNALSEFNQNGSLSGSTLLEIRDQYKDVVPDIDTYINALSKQNITEEDVKKTLAELAVAQAESAIQTGELSSENVDLIAALLKENGVLNSVEAATLLVNKAKAEMAANSAENYNKFISETTAIGLTKSQLTALYVQEKIYNNTKLNPQDKVNAFNQIVTSAGLASLAIDTTTQAFKDLDAAGKSEYINNKIQEFIDNYGAKKLEIMNSITDGGDYENQTDEYLESLKDIVELRQSELSLLEKQDRPISEQIAKQYEIKAALQDELNYLISIGEDQVEINNLRGELLDIDAAIVELQEEEKELRKQEYEERRSYLENELSLMEAQDKNYQEQTAKIREIQEVLHLYADYLRSIGASQEEINDLSIDWLDYMEQIQQLQIDYYESERSLLESQIAIRKNQASIDEIISMYQKEQDLLHQQAEYLRLIGAEQEEINNLSSEWYNIQQDIESLKDDALQNALEAATKPIEEEINLREEAKQQEEEQLDIEEKKKAVLEAQKKLLDTMAQRNVRVYNTATGQWEWQSNAQDIQDAKEELENAQKEYDDAIYDEQTNLLQEQVDWAEKIYEKIQDGDATNEEIVELMKFFSNQWSDSNEEGKKFLHDANIVLGSIIGAKYDDSLGVWTDANGHAIFNDIGSAISANKNEDGVWIPVDVTKVRDTIGNFDVEKLMRQYEIEKNNLVNPMQYIQSFNNGRTYNTNSGNTTSYSLNGVTIPQNASKELAEVLTKIFDDMKLYGN